MMVSFLTASPVLVLIVVLALMVIVLSAVYKEVVLVMLVPVELLQQFSDSGSELPSVVLERLVYSSDVFLESIDSASKLLLPVNVAIVLFTFQSGYDRCRINNRCGVG